MSPKWMKRIIVILVLILFGFSLFHASWLAPTPKGKPKLIASGPLDIPRDTNGCVVSASAGYGTEVVSPETQMLQTAVGNGADAIVIDSELVDGKAVLPRYFATNCAADAARTPLSEPLRALSAPDQFIRVKDAVQARALLAELPADDLTRIFMGPKEAEIAPFKGKSAFSIGKARQCTSDYKGSGLWGGVPASCKDGTMLLTLGDLGFGLWGWPNRFMARMSENNVRLIVAADVEGDTITGLTELTQYNDIASSYNGYIWVDNIAELGPALKR